MRKIYLITDTYMGKIITILVTYLSAVNSLKTWLLIKISEGKCYFKIYKVVFQVLIRISTIHKKINNKGQ